ncbi:MAG: formate dehydrogenase accessory protein FdhE [Acidobacteriota bacterium]|nr:formate dehydrogenase accessory protein FdhE [Acidobacteriota bacterium]
MPTGVERGVQLRQARRNRAVALQTARPHAADLLDSYLGVLDCQEPVYKTSRDAHWPDLYNPENNTPPRLNLDRLPYDSLAQPFREFVHEVQKVMPEALTQAATLLDTGNLTVNAEVLQKTALQQDFSASIQSLQIEMTALHFFGRAFLEPIVEALAHHQDRPLHQAGATVCPLCNWPPQFATLQDETEIQGRRSLVCALCSVAWPFPRTVCIKCGEANAENLHYHVADSLPYMRVEACNSCHTYIKVADLRAEGLLAPVVDELASVELDLWCKEQGLTKNQPNLLGM